MKGETDGTRYYRFCGVSGHIGYSLGYGWGYRNGLKKLPDDITSVIRKQAEEIAKKNIQELKDKMEGGG